MLNAIAGGLWPRALWMMVLATAGGWTGARIAKQLPNPWVRWLANGTGLVMTGVFLCASEAGQKPAAVGHLGKFKGTCCCLKGTFSPAATWSSKSCSAKTLAT